MIETVPIQQAVTGEVEHIRAIVERHQARGIIREPPAPVPVVDSLRIATYALESRAVHVIRRFEQTARIVTDTTKVLQILVNLITNASQAFEQGRQTDRRLTLQIDSTGTQCVRISKWLTMESE